MVDVLVYKKHLINFTNS